MSDMNGVFCGYRSRETQYITETVPRTFNQTLALEVVCTLGERTEMWKTQGFLRKTISVFRCLSWSQDGSQLVAAHGLSPAMGLAALRACHGSQWEVCVAKEAG